MRLHQDGHGGAGILAADQVADDLDLPGRDADIAQIGLSGFVFHVQHPPLSVLPVSAEGPGGGELAQLVAHHILLDIHGHVLAPVMDGDGVAHESGEDGGAAAPGLQHFLLVFRVHFLDPLQKLRGNIRAFFNGSAHILLASLTSRCGA